MHSAKFLPRCGVGRKVELWYALLFFYLQCRTSQHFLSVAPCAAGSSPAPGASAARARTPPSANQCGQSPSGPPSSKAEIQGSLKRFCGEPGATPGPSRRYTVSHASDVPRMRPPRQSSTLEPGRAGSILLVFASLLIGKADGKHRAALSCGASENVLRAQEDVIITDANSRELAIAFAVLAAAERHFRQLVSTPEPFNTGAAECSAASKRRASLGPGRAKEEVLRSRSRMQRCASTDTVCPGTVSSPSRSAENNTGRCAPMSLFRAVSQNTLAQHGDSGDSSTPVTLSRHIVDKKQESSKETPTSVRRRGSKLLKYLFSSRQHLMRSRPSGEKGQIPVQFSEGCDSLAWAGVMTVVSNAICKACMSFGPEEAENDITGQVTLYPPKHSRASWSAAGGVDLSTAEPSRRPSVTLGDIASEGGTVDSDKPPRSRKRASAKKSKSEAASSESSPACSSDKEQPSSKKNPIRKKASSLPKLFSSTSKGVPSSQEKPASVSSSKQAPRVHSDSRRRSVDRDSAGSSSPQPQSPHPSTRARRWLRFRASKSSEKPGEVDAGVKEETVVELAADEKETLGETEELENNPCEEAVRRALEAEGTSPIITTAASLWELSKTVKVTQVTEEIRSYLPKDDSMHDAVVKALDALSIKATKLITADIPVLLCDAAKWIDWKRQDKITSDGQAESLLTSKAFRYALGVTCAERLETSTANAFSKAILEEAHLLQNELICLAKEVSPDVQLMPTSNSLPDLVAKMQVLIGALRALNMKDGAAVAVGQTHMLLTALAATLDDNESGECVRLYRRNVEAAGSDRDLLVSDLAATSAALKEEIVSQVLQTYLDAVQDRISRATSPASVKQALGELISSIVKNLVSQSVEADMQQAATVRIESSFPRFYHSLGLLNDSKFRADIMSYHISRVKKALPCTFYSTMPVLLPRLAKEYLWLRQTARIGIESLFHRDAVDLNTRVLVLVALSEVLNLTHSVLVAKLRRTVKVAKQLDLQTVAQAIDYIYEQLTSSATEDPEAVLACIMAEPQIASPGHSLKELLSLPPARSPNASCS